jgi:hypothetical protein
MTWESGFVALSAVLGEPLEQIVDAIGERGVENAASVVRGLKSRSRASRATALAAVLAGIASELDRMAAE